MLACYRSRRQAQLVPWKLVLLLWPAIAIIADAELPLSAETSLENEEKEIAFLTARVGDALANERRLAATNAQLRQEVDGWSNVGARVMKREAGIIDAIKHSREGDQSALRASIVARLGTSKSDQKALVALSERSSGTAETKSAEHDHLPHVLVSWHLLVLGFTVLATAVICWARVPATVSRIFSREKVLELSELQLEGVPVGFGEAYLLVQPSGGLRSRTRVAEQMEDSCVLRFDEVLTISMRKRDGPCAITIFNHCVITVQETRIGTATFQLSDLLGSGSQAPSQYFRFKVQGDMDSPTQQLHVAMRIRDVTGVHGATAKAGLPLRTKGPAFSV